VPATAVFALRECSLLRIVAGNFSTTFLGDLLASSLLNRENKPSFPHLFCLRLNEPGRHSHFVESTRKSGRARARSRRQSSTRDRFHVSGSENVGIDYRSAADRSFRGTIRVRSHARYLPGAIVSACTCRRLNLAIQMPNFRGETFRAVQVLFSSRREATRRYIEFDIRDSGRTNGLKRYTNNPRGSARFNSLIRLTRYSLSGCSHYLRGDVAPIPRSRALLLNYLFQGCSYNR